MSMAHGCRLLISTVQQNSASGNGCQYYVAQYTAYTDGQVELSGSTEGGIKRVSKNWSHTANRNIDYTILA
jgi:3D (Asp-Asp-Asp) domain-containing protein